MQKSILTLFAFAIIAFGFNKALNNFLFFPDTNLAQVPAFLRGDINRDGIVNSIDWSLMNSKWFSTVVTDSDINGDGIVNSIDFSILNSNWLKSPVVIVPTPTPSTPPPPPTPVVSPPTPVAPTSGSVAVQLYRYNGSAGQVQFSNGFPLQQGKLQISQLGNVALFLNGVEQPIFVKALGGTFPDGSLRSILIQGDVTGPAAGQAIQGFVSFGTPRTTATVTEVPPPSTLSVALLPTSANYLVSTEIAGKQLTASQVQSSTTDIQGMDADFETMAKKIIANFGGIKTPRTVADYEHVLTHYQHYLQTADPYWYDVAWRMGDSERIYVEGTFAPEWLINPEGVTLHYWMGGDERSRVAVSKMATWLTGSTEYIYKWNVADGGYRFKGRSLIGAISCAKIACTMGKDGYTAPYTIPYNINQILPTIITKLKTVQDPSGLFPGTLYGGGQKNYMVGLLLTGLTEYYDDINPDPSVIAMIKKSIDYMWTTQWVPSGQGFYYCSIPNVGDCGNMPIIQSAGLNNLILPAYAWYYNKTKDPAYLAIADQIFAGNRPNRVNWLGFVKQFDEAFYRVANYYAWRQ